jgi:hypothetical protein
MHWGYADADGDGVGAGPGIGRCGGATPPRGLAAVAGDCAPDDAARWRELPYLYRDADGDGATVPQVGVVCAGVALPAGYADAPSGDDCDDRDEAVSVSMQAYGDADADGVGAGAPVVLCTGGALPPGWAATDGDCAPADAARWRDFSYAYRDADLDGRTVAEAGTLCVGAEPPAGYLAAASGDDCDDHDAAAWQVRNAVLDADGDGFGAGEPVALCTGTALPAGWVAPDGPTDCAPDDDARWRTWTYAFRDADRDGRTVASPGTLCIGTAPPAGYATARFGDDCDDANPLVWVTVVGYADADGDGVGAGAGVAACTDGAIPAGQVATGTDCAPEDGSRWQLLPYALADRDGDGLTAPVTPGNVCAAAVLPEPYRAVAVGLDCDDGERSVWRAVVRYPDADGDGVGATPRAIVCLGSGEPPGYSRFGWDVDDADPAVQRDGADDELVELLQ